jgi:hypothetical protein
MLCQLTSKKMKFRLRRTHRSFVPFYIALLFGLTETSAHADVMALYNFNSPMLASHDSDPNSSASDLSIAAQESGLGFMFGDPAPSFDGLTLYTTAGDARTHNQSITFTLSPLSGYALSLSSISFEIAARTQSSADQTSQAAFYTDRDNQNTPIALGFAFDSVANGPLPSAFTPFSYDLTSNSLYQNVNGPITFSIYIFGSNNDGEVYLDNIQVQGMAAPVPEPSCWILFSLGSGVVLSVAASRYNCSACRR